MAPRKKAPQARRPRKPAARRVYRKKRGTPKTQVDKYVHTTLRSTLDATTTAGGKFESYFTLNNPTNGTDWASWNDIYKEYRVTCLEVKYVPILTTTTGMATSADEVQDLTIFFVKDDSAQAGAFQPTIAESIAYDGCFQRRLLKPWKLKFYPAKQNFNDTLPRGWQKTNDTASSVGCCAYTSLANTAYENTKIGLFVFTYYVTFRNKF